MKFEEFRGEMFNKNGKKKVKEKIPKKKGLNLIAFQNRLYQRHIQGIQSPLVNLQT